jgi:hypothetical protein
MTKAHYFVVVGTITDDNSVLFSVDNITADARFSEGLIWNEEAEAWERADDAASKANDQRISDELIARLASGR